MSFIMITQIILRVNSKRRVNKKEKNADAVCNKILSGLVWQSGITQGWHLPELSQWKPWREHLTACFPTSYSHLLYSRARQVMESRAL